MAIKSALLGLAGAAALSLGLSATAQAGCGGIGNCDAGSVHSSSAYAPDFGPTTVRTGTPYDYHSSVRFQRAPHVQITRIHGQGPVAGLSDAPHGNSGGCNAHATGYCYGHRGTPVSVQMYGRPAPQPAPRPAPVMAAPVPAERVVAVGGGFDPSKFQPRIYGDLSVTPGIAHLPTSIVDRDPARAQAALDRIAPGSVTPALSGVPIRHGVPYAAPYRLDPVPGAVAADLPPRGVNMPGGRFGPAPVVAAPVMRAPAPMMQPPMMQAPVMQAPLTQAPVMQAPVMQAPIMRAPAPQGLALAGGPSVPTGFPGAAGAPIPQADGTYSSQVGVDGTYWEKVSGVTTFGDTVATSVICKRKLPTQVVNPTVGVPYPVPTPVPGPVVDGCELPHGLRPYEARGRY